MKYTLRSLFPAMVLAMVLALPLAVPRAVQAQDQAQDQAQELLIAFSDFPPYKFLMNDRPAGIDIEILQQMASRMGVTLQYRTCSFEECLESMRTGGADVMSSLLRTPDREQYIDFVNPPYAVGSDHVFFVLKGQENRIRKFSDLSGLKIGVEAGARFFPEFDHDTSLDKITAASFQELVAMLDNGMLDCFLCSYSEGEFWLKVLGLSEVIVPASYVVSSKNKVYMGFSKASPNKKLLMDFKQALESVVDDGSVERISARFIRQ